MGISLSKHFVYKFSNHCFYFDFRKINTPSNGIQFIMDKFKNLGDRYKKSNNSLLQLEQSNENLILNKTNRKSTVGALF